LGGGKNPKMKSENQKKKVFVQKFEIWGKNYKISVISVKILENTRIIDSKIYLKNNLFCPFPFRVGLPPFDLLLPYPHCLKWREKNGKCEF